VANFGDNEIKDLLVQLASTAKTVNKNSQPSRRRRDIGQFQARVSQAGRASGQVKLKKGRPPVTLRCISLSMLKQAQVSRRRWRPTNFARAERNFLFEPGSHPGSESAIPRFFYRP